MSTKTKLIQCVGAVTGLLIGGALILNHINGEQIIAIEARYSVVLIAYVLMLISNSLYE